MDNDSLVRFKIYKESRKTGAKVYYKICKKSAIIEKEKLYDYGN
jgi:hypothetical protein